MKQVNKKVFFVNIANILGRFYTHQFYKKYSIGKYTYGKPKILYKDQAKIKIGNYTSIAKGVIIFLGGNHNIDWITTYPFPDISIKDKEISKGNVEIGNDVWIGRNVTILSGVTIGDGAVIGTSTVVAKNVKPYSIVVGNPGIHIKYRFDKKIINELLSIKWWNWEHKKVLENKYLLCSNNINYFIKLYKN